MKRIGADLFVDALVKEGVEYIFGIPGGVVIPLFDKQVRTDSFHTNAPLLLR